MPAAPSISLLVQNGKVTCASGTMARRFVPTPPTVPKDRADNCSPATVCGVCTLFRCVFAKLCLTSLYNSIKRAPIRIKLDRKYKNETLYVCCQKSYDITIFH